ncbi:MAG: ribosome maturation factor RimM [Candidatus Limnocylindrales bacterium]
MSALDASAAPPPIGEESPAQPGQRLVVGLVRGLHGLRGAVRVEALTDRPEERFALGARLYREGSEDALTVIAAARDGPGWRLRFAEVSDRTAAESLRAVYLEAAVVPGGGLARGEYWWHEVIGTAVRDVDGTELGTVVDLYRTGGAEVLLVRGPRGELDVPVVRPLVRIFAPRRGEIVVDGDALGLRGDAPVAAPGPDAPSDGAAAS